MKRIRLSMRGKRAVSGYLFILPFILGFLVFMMVPLFTSLEMSFSEVTVSASGFTINPYWGIEDTKYITTNMESSPAAVSELVGDVDEGADIHVDIATGAVRVTPVGGKEATLNITDAELAGKLATLFQMGSHIYDVTVPAAESKIIVDTFGMVEKTVKTEPKISAEAFAALIPGLMDTDGCELTYTAGKQQIKVTITPAEGKARKQTIKDAAAVEGINALLGAKGGSYTATVNSIKAATPTERVVLMSETTMVEQKTSSITSYVASADVAALLGTADAKHLVTITPDTGALVIATTPTAGEATKAESTEPERVKDLSELFGLGKAMYYSVTVSPAVHRVQMVETIIEGDTIDAKMEEEGFLAVVLDVLGLDNFTYALTVDPTYNQLLVEEITKIGTHTIAIIVVAFVIALLLNQEFKGRALVRAIFFLPVILSSGVLVNLETDNILMSGMQELISEQTPFTVTDSMMEILRLTGLGGDLLDVVFDLIAEVYNIVMGSGIQIIVFLSGLQNVPASLYEAADVEGCTKWESFWMITFPMVSPLLIVNIIYTIVDFFTKMDGDLSDLLDENLLNFHYDRMSAMSWIYFAVTLAMIGLSALVLSKGVVSNDD